MAETSAPLDRLVEYHRAHSAAAITAEGEVSRIEDERSDAMRQAAAPFDKPLGTARESAAAIRQALSSASIYALFREMAADAPELQRAALDIYVPDESALGSLVRDIVSYNRRPGDSPPPYIIDQLRRLDEVDAEVVSSDKPLPAMAFSLKYENSGEGESQGGTWLVDSVTGLVEGRPRVDYDEEPFGLYSLRRPRQIVLPLTNAESLHSRTGRFDEDRWIESPVITTLGATSILLARRASENTSRYDARPVALSAGLDGAFRRKSIEYGPRHLVIGAAPIQEALAALAENRVDHMAVRALREAVAKVVPST